MLASMTNERDTVEFMKRPEVDATMAQKHASTYVQVREGLLPPPIKVGVASIWVRREIQAVARARAAGWSNDQIRRLVQELVAQRPSLAKDLWPLIDESPADASPATT
jgi:prophage regulatory protein